MRNGQTRTSSRHKASEAAGLDCATAFQKMTLECVADIKAHHSSACAGDAEAVHQIRVAITRLRAAVAFFAPIVVDAEWLRLKKEIAWLNGPLGAARDSDVVMEYARRKRYRAWAQGMIGERLDQRQMQDHRRLVRCLRSARTQRLVAAMAGWIRQGPWLARYKRRKRRGGSAILLRARTRPLARTAGPQGPAPEDFGCVTPSPAADQGQTLPLHAGSAHGNRRAVGPGRIPSPAPAGKTIAARIGRHARSRALRRSCQRIAAGRKWQTRQEASAGLSPSKG